MYILYYIKGQGQFFKKEVVQLESCLSRLFFCIYACFCGFKRGLYNTSIKTAGLMNKNPFKGDILVSDLIRELARCIEILTILESTDMDEREIGSYKQLFQNGLAQSHSLFNVIGLGTSTNPKSNQS